MNMLQIELSPGNCKMVLLQMFVFAIKCLKYLIIYNTCNLLHLLNISVTLICVLEG